MLVHRLSSSLSRAWEYLPWIHTHKTQRQLLSRWLNARECTKAARMQRQQVYLGEWERARRDPFTWARGVSLPSRRCVIFIASLSWPRANPTKRPIPLGAKNGQGSTHCPFIECGYGSEKVEADNGHAARRWVNRCAGKFLCRSGDSNFIDCEFLKKSAQECGSEISQSRFLSTWLNESTCMCEGKFSAQHSEELLRCTQSGELHYLKL
jgi:hypothetical protein